MLNVHDSGLFPGSDSQSVVNVKISAFKIYESSMDQTAQDETRFTGTFLQTLSLGFFCRPNFLRRATSLAVANRSPWPISTSDRRLMWLRHLLHDLHWFPASIKVAL